MCRFAEWRWSMGGKGLRSDRASPKLLPLNSSGMYETMPAMSSMMWPSPSMMRSRFAVAIPASCSGPFSLEGEGDALQRAVRVNLRADCTAMARQRQIGGTRGRRTRSRA